MKELIAKADVLIEALPYIQTFRNEIIVVKFGGSAMEEKACRGSILTDIVFMECVGMLPLIVHGGGRAISQKMSEAGLRAQFVRGLRVTDEKTIGIVAKVLTEEMNPAIVASLREKGAKARTLRGEEILHVTKLSEVDEETGETLDWGFVGRVEQVDVEPIRAYLQANIIPVITPLGRGADGQVYNINADDAAAAIAKTLKARKLALLSDVPGLLRNPDDPDSLLSTLRLSEVESLIVDGVISGGMIPKVRSGVESLEAGVQKIHIIDGRLAHSLLLEIFTEEGVGTEIVRDDDKPADD
ncbi:MAG: acetylglutamate kinase [Kiritimatiellae bacterium]|nr:acetylglutamate kinase [Kiritimatiellia bacterium]